jgi:pyrroline-5-carboxylate reductase
MQLLIIGTGKMAEAIIAGAINYHDIEVTGRDSKKIDQLLATFPSLKSAGKLEEGIDIGDKIVILAVKPYALEAVSFLLKSKAKALISVLAGTTLASLKGAIQAKYYIRSMPNLAASHQKSMTTLYGDDAFKAEAIEICESFGKALWLGSEKEIDIATAVAGSGPAFLALVAEALADGAVKEGIKREDARVLVHGLFEGFVPLLEVKHPAIIKDEVMSPGGTTAAGYAALEEGGVRDSMIKAIQKAYSRAKGS